MALIDSFRPTARIVSIALLFLLLAYYLLGPSSFAKPSNLFFSCLVSYLFACAVERKQPSDMKQLQGKVRSAKTREELEQIKKENPNVTFLEFNKSIKLGDSRATNEQLQNSAQQKGSFVKFSITKKKNQAEEK